MPSHAICMEIEPSSSSSLIHDASRDATVHIYVHLKTTSPYAYNGGLSPITVATRGVRGRVLQGACANIAMHSETGTAARGLSLHFKSMATNSKHMPLFLEGGAPRPRQDRNTERDNDHAGAMHPPPPPSSHLLSPDPRGYYSRGHLFLNKMEPVWTSASPGEGKVVGVHMHAFFSFFIPHDAEVVPAPKASAETLSASARLSPHLH